MEVSGKKSSAPVSPGPIDNIVRGTAQEAALPLPSSSLLGDFTVAVAVSRLVITGHLLAGGRQTDVDQQNRQVSLSSFTWRTHSLYDGFKDGLK